MTSAYTHLYRYYYIKKEYATLCGVLNGPRWTSPSWLWADWDHVKKHRPEYNIECVTCVSLFDLERLAELDV